MNAPLASWLRLRDHLSDDLFGGPRLLEASWVINPQKAGALAAIHGPALDRRCRRSPD